MEFLATKFHTAAQKEKFTKDIIRFIDGGFKGRFTKSMYEGLHCSGNFGFIAHYNIDGFKYEQFGTEDRQEDFLRQLKRGCLRDLHTQRKAELWGDVKTALIEHYDWEDGFSHLY